MTDKKQVTKRIEEAMKEAQGVTKPRAWAEYFRRYGHAPARVEQRGRWTWVAIGGEA